MAVSLVMTPDGRRDRQALAAAELVPDGFSVWALPLPPLWLVLNRAYTVAGLVLAAMITLGALAAAYPDVWVGWLAGAAAMVLPFFVALEGGDWIRANRERQGFRTIAVLATAKRNEAEAALSALIDAAPAGPPPSTALTRTTLPARAVPTGVAPIDALVFPGAR